MLKTEEYSISSLLQEKELVEKLLVAMVSNPDWTALAADDCWMLVDRHRAEFESRRNEIIEEEK